MSNLQPAARGGRSASDKKTVVIGIYGVPGSGKTFLLDHLRQELGQEDFAIYEGSGMIANVVPGGLEAFDALDDQSKQLCRERAIDTVANECAGSGKAAVVAGHFMFWPEEEEAGQPVWTQHDENWYTHILYLDVPADVVAQRCLNDKKRIRPPPASVEHLQQWQQHEKSQLRRLCREHGILFSLVSPSSASIDSILPLLRDFQGHTEEENLSCAYSRLDDILASSSDQLDTMLVMDADRTLAAHDTGTLFWSLAGSGGPTNEECLLKALFSSPLGYSYAAFRQATLMYEEVANDEKFEALCREVASRVTMHREFVSLLQQVAERDHVGAVIVTCGLRRVWEKVLEKEGLSNTVQVIGGGRIADGFVVTAAVKAALVSRLKSTHEMYVWAFGDSVLDLDMLIKADQAVVVVGEENNRSNVDEALMNAINNDGLRARQAVIPSTALPRLDASILPLIQLMGEEFVNSVFGGLHVVHATNKTASRLLSTPMRDASIAGPELGAAHRHAGWYLATEFLADVVGTEEFSMEHVQGHHTSGHRLLREQETSIVALMRGGEEMARGVHKAFPRARFVHAFGPDDINLGHLQGQSAVLLVDSVVNSGKTVVQFVQHIRGLYPTVRIVIVAGVVQNQAVSRGSVIEKLAHRAKLSLVALRLSENKFTGSGKTDTGNRLCNTTHLL